MPEATGYVGPDYLRAAAELLRPFKQRTYERMQLQPGDTLLDLGCGAGADTLPLGERLAGSGQVVGVDLDRHMAARAAAGAGAAGLSRYVFHLCAEATSLPLAANCFDACRSERLFQHLPHPELALAEMIRVTRPGGRVVVLDTDHGTWSVDSPDTDIERRLTRFKTEHFGHNGYAGRQLYRLFRMAGLQDITCEMISGHFTDYALCRFMFLLDQVEPAALQAGVLTPDELERWRAGLEQAAASGIFFCSESMVLAAGRKPETS